MVTDGKDPGRTGPEQARSAQTGAGDRRPGAAQSPAARAAAGNRAPATPTDELAKTPMTQQLGRVFVVILAILFGVFAVANSQAVDFSWVFGSTQVRQDPTGQGTVGGVPLILLLLAAFLVGALISTFVTWQVHRRQRVSPRGR